MPRRVACSREVIELLSLFARETDGDGWILLLLFSHQRFRVTKNSHSQLTSKTPKGAESPRKNRGVLARPGLEPGSCLPFGVLTGLEPVLWLSPAPRARRAKRRAVSRS